jgi:hypothetical protein
MVLSTGKIIGQVRESHLRTSVVFIFSRPDFANTVQYVKQQHQRR